ncbi:hypothetical protein [Cellulomonas sp.]|uniref:hypothetical protein n=1 Tax=Cellulomonas sp. TaxID=40001 RepID=UPI001AFDD923|nr:hypothetical protein [Cellulomonas sp.]MBO9556909.1 hypothetical protein [Cellulomonas sp.]
MPAADARRVRDLLLPAAVLLLVALVALVVWELPWGPVARWRMRRRMIALLDPDLPPDERARAVSRAREMVPLIGLPAAAALAPPPLPAGADPTALRFEVVHPASSAGAPGFRVRVPWHSVPARAADAHGRCQPATVLLGAHRALLVVVLGRVGAVEQGGVLAGARDRPAQARALGERRAAVGDVVHAMTAAGPAWRHTFAVGTRHVTDTHVDRDGWAFAVGVLRTADDTSVDGLADAVLASWRWLTPEGAPPAPRGPAAAAPGRLAIRTPDLALAASCRAPAAPAELVAADVPCPDDAWTAAYLRLSPTSSLVVTVSDADPGRDARTTLEQPERTAWGPRVTPAGPVRERATPAGVVATRTLQVAGLARTEARLDRRGRTWRWLLTYAPDETAALGVLEEALQTWRWED